MMFNENGSGEFESKNQFEKSREENNDYLVEGELPSIPRRVHSPEIQREQLMAYFADGNIMACNWARKAYELTDEELVSPEMRAAAKQCLINKLTIPKWKSHLHSSSLYSFLESFKIEDLISDPDVQAVAKANVIDLLKSVTKTQGETTIGDILGDGEIGESNYFEKIKSYINFFKISKDVINSEELQLIVKEAVIALLSHDDGKGSRDKCKKVLDLNRIFYFSDNIINDPEVQTLSKEVFLNELDGVRIRNANRLALLFKIPKEEEKNIQKQAAIKLLSEGCINSFATLDDEISFPDEFWQSEEAIGAAIAGIRERLFDGVIEDAVEAKELFNIPNDNLYGVCIEGILHMLKDNKIDDAVDVISQFDLPTEVLRNPNLLEQLKGRVAELLSGGNRGDGYTLIESFKMPRVVAQEAGKSAIQLLLSRRLWDDPTEAIADIQDNLEISNEDLSEIATQSMTEAIYDGNLELAIELKQRFKISDVVVSNALSGLIETGDVEKVISSINLFSESILRDLERKYFLLSYKKELGLPSNRIYNKFVEFKRSNDEINLAVFIENVKNRINGLVSSEKQTEDIENQEDYRELIETVYPSHSEWSDFDSIESCSDRSEDIEHFQIRPIYTVDLAEGVEMELKPDQKRDIRALESLEKPILNIQTKFHEVDFEKEKMFAILDQEIDSQLSQITNKDVFVTREEKIYGLLLECLIGKMDSNQLKELVIGYQFAQFEDIRNYLDGTREQAGKAKNPEYAYLLELKEFFADHLKDVERKIASEAQQNQAIVKVLPSYYHQLRSVQLQEQKRQEMDKLQVNKIGLQSNLLDRIIRTLETKTDKSGKKLDLVKEDEGGNLILGPKGQALIGMISSEQNKAAQAIQVLIDNDIDPKSIHLGELNLAEYINAQQMINRGEFDEEVFDRYITQAFQMIFADELKTIDLEVEKYRPKDEIKREKQMRKLEGFITKNHTSAHARAVGGVCVSGDNPLDETEDESGRKECLWNMPNYFQLVLRDSENKICQGLVLLHHFQDQDKTILTASFNPSSTYLYKVDETQLFKGLLNQLIIFAQENNFDIVAVPKNEEIRTNRTGGEFERAIEQTIRQSDQSFSFSQSQTFSHRPNYQLNDLDVLWTKDVSINNH